MELNIKSEDVEIINEIKKGNNLALDLIFEKYKTMVNIIARKYFLIGAEQEDLCQEGMVGLYKACLTYDEKKSSSFKTFAYTCVKSQILTAIKSANRKKNLILTNALSFDSKNGIDFVTGQNIDEDRKIMYLPNFQESPETELIDKESYAETIQKIKESLSVFEFQILELYLDGFKCGQIAGITNNSYKTIDNALYRIKRKLQFLNYKNKQ